MMKSKKWTIALFIVYLLALSSVILLKNRFSFAFFGIRISFANLDMRRSINLIPFGGMLVLNGAPSYNEVIYNAVAFVPFGIFLCMLRKKKSFASLIVPIFLTSLFYEAIQFVFILGASDITDLLANTFGGIVGIGIFLIFHKIHKVNRIT